MDSRSIYSANRYSDNFSYISLASSNAIEKLRSKKTIAHALIPAFMQANDANVRRSVTRKISKKTMTPDERTPSPVQKYSNSYDFKNNEKRFITDPVSDNISPTIDVIEEYKELFEGLRKQTSKEKGAVKVMNLILNLDDLMSFVDDNEITRKGIDSCLTLLKKYNYEILTRDEAKSNIIIASTAFSWKIFNDEKFEELHAPTYVFLYE
jgi:hypothetical protein